MLSIIRNILAPKENNNICFFCFKNTDDSSFIDEKIEIHNEFCRKIVSLADIMNVLFPYHDMLSSQACEACSDLILKVYILLQKNNSIKIMLNNVVEKLDEELLHGENLQVDKIKYEIKIKLPNYKNTNETEFDDQSLHNEDLEDDNETYKQGDSLINIQKVYTCKKCNMDFNSVKSLKMHNKISHNNTNKGVVCDICGKTFNGKNALQNHLRCHKLKECPYCMKLKTYSHIKYHTQYHNNKVKRQRNIIYYNCNDCDYKAQDKSSLEAHKNKVHLNIRPFICSICCKGFYRKNALIEHEMTHSKSRKLETCDICGESFQYKKSLNYHLRLHSGIKEFGCDFCDKKFLTPSTRYEHVKRKHGEKNECCPICGVLYCLKKDLNRHMKTVHQKDMADL